MHNRFSWEGPKIVIRSYNIQHTKAAKMWNKYDVKVAKVRQLHSIVDDTAFSQLRPGDRHES